MNVTWFSWTFTALTLAATLQSACQRRQPRLLGLGVGPPRAGDDDGRHVRAAGDLPVPGLWPSASSRGSVRVHARPRLFHVGTDLFALPINRRRLFRHARHATSNYAVLYTAKGMASIIGGWVGALLFGNSQELGAGFLRLRADGACRGGHGRRAARSRARRSPAVSAAPAAAEVNGVSAGAKVTGGQSPLHGVTGTVPFP